LLFYILTSWLLFEVFQAIRKLVVEDRELRLHGPKWLEVLDNISSHLLASHLRKEHDKQILISLNIESHKEIRQVKINKIHRKKSIDIGIVPTSLILMIILFRLVKRQLFINSSKQYDHNTIHSRAQIPVHLLLGGRHAFEFAIWVVLCLVLQTYTLI